MSKSVRARAEANFAKTGRYDIAAVVAECDIVEVIGKFVTLKARGHEFVGLCPFHHDRTPSFTVIPKLQPHGRFKCHPCGATGDVVDFIRQLKNVDYREACRFLVGDLALEYSDADRARLKKEAEARAKADDAEAEKTRRKAYDIWRGGRPISGTPVEAYLRARGITGPLPAGLRFAPQLWCSETKDEMPGMIAAMLDARGAFQALHRTYLARGLDGAWRKAALNSPKKIWGRFMGSAIRLHDSSGGALYIAEGIETTLAVREGLARRPDLAAGAAVWAAGSLANLSRLALPMDDRGVCTIKKIVLCMDNDMSDPKLAWTETVNAELNYCARGIEVLAAWPPEGKDFNDMLQEGGV